MQVEFGAARIDHHIASVVVEKEGNVHALRGYLNPPVAAALPLPLPDDGAEVVARALGDGRDDSVWSGGQATEFDHPHGCAPDFRNRSIKDEASTFEQAEAIEKKIKAGPKPNGAQTEGA